MDSSASTSLERPAKGDAEKGFAPEEASARSIHGISWFLVVISTLSSIFLYSLDNTIVADIIPVIVNDFHSVAELGWLSVGFMIGGVAVIMPFGKLYGLFNAKWLYICSVVLFEASSALCGGAPNMSAMIVGRVFAGAGGIGMYLGVLTLLSVNTGLVWGIGTVLGPVVGGGFEKVNWRWAFYINLIIGGVFAPVYLFLLPSFDPAPGAPFTLRAKRLDFMGIILSIGALISLIMAINFGDTLYPWSSGQIISLFVVSGALFIIFGIQQAFSLFTVKTDRMFPAHFLKNKEATLLFILAAACNACCFIPIYYIPVYFQFTRGDGALDSAVRLLPLIFVLSATILTNGFLMSKLGYYQPWYVLGSALALAAGVLLSRIDEHTSTSKIYGYEVLLGVGTGAYIQAGYAVIQAVVDPADMYYAISFMMIAQIGGICLALSICSAVFVNTAKNALIPILPGVPITEIQNAISGTSSAFFNSLSPDVKAQALSVVVHSLQKGFILVYVAAAVGLLGSVFLRSRKAFMTAAAGA
ncbi:MAG: hypothetical protein M1839_009540 [Geoglossum umbratile]|nr:MAG: hypothetical protein M1839_009540 [Geoglossum umbratile]